MATESKHQHIKSVDTTTELMKGLTY